MKQFKLTNLNILLILLILSAVSINTSAQEKDNCRLLLKESSKDYYLEISEITKKCSKGGDPVCNNYIRIAKIYRGFKIYGMNYVSLISRFKGIDSKFVTKSDDINNCSIELIYRRKGMTRKTDSSLIVSKLLALYDVKIEPSTKPTEYFNLEIVDESKANMVRNKRKKVGKTSSKSDSGYGFKNVSLPKIAKFIGWFNSGKILTCSECQRTQYCFNVEEIKSFKELNELLIREYGLEFVKKESEMLYLHITKL